MMSPVRFSSLLIVCGLIAGCTSTPTPSASDKSSSKNSPGKAAVAAKPVVAAPAPVTPAPTVAPVVTAPVAAAPVVPHGPRKLSPEAAATVARLTQGSSSDALQHELSDSTDFPEAISSLQAGAVAPKVEFVDDAKQPPIKGLTADGNSTNLVERDWTGLVLVPISTSLSKAYTSEVRLLKVEAHPLSDGRVRIWTRVQNIGRQPLPAQIACSFQMRGTGTPSSPYFYQLDVPGKKYRDVFFVSPEGELTAYTVLVRSEGMTGR